MRMAFLIALCCALLLGGCAQTGALTGGPADSTAPTVVMSVPAARSTYVRTKTIRLVFSDYVERSVRSQLRIQPSVPFSVSYAGDEIDVELRQPLADSTTYIVTLGTQYTSRYGTPPAEGYTLVFSTGNTIDTGIVAGKVVAASMSGIEVFCLPAESDTLPDVRLVSPMYRVAVGSNGAFRLEGLRDGVYRIAAVRDANGNGLLDADEDFATATSAITVRGGIAPQITLRPVPPVDSLGPYIRRARALTSRAVELQASERIGSTRPFGFAVADSSGLRTVRLDTILFSRDSRDRLILRLRDSLDTGSFRLTLADSAFADEAGNVNIDTLRTLTFVGSDRPDSIVRRTVSDTTTKRSSDDGIILGVFTDSLRRSPFYLLRLIDPKGAPVRAAAVQHGAAVRFDSVPPGEYRVDVVLDRNGNGRYDAGNVHPWTDAEDVVALPVTLQVRPRWTQEGVRFDVGKIEP